MTKSRSKEIKLVYVLDRDFEGSNIFENEDYKIHLYNRRALLRGAIASETPDLVMLDLFTKRRKAKAPIEYDVFQEVKSYLEREESVDEKALGLLQVTKELCRTVLDTTHYVSGIKDLVWLTSREDIQVVFPIAIFSRHGKSLLTSEEILEISSFGAYLTWKSKENTSISDFTEREIESIDAVIDLYKEQAEQLPQRLIKLTEDINRREKFQEKMYKQHKVYEAVFLLFVVLTAISNLDGIIATDLVNLTRSSLSLIYPKAFSIVAMVTVCIYLISKYVIKTNNKELSSIYSEVNSVLHDLITQKNKS
ncbi:hypothetical protein PQE20_03305 [Vibrio harveyi]|uniref:hypothetical protein n=1 Tax=Vibrio harveyi TaxID=669 RepID=UPI00234D14C2|nr:hypothetical protein [Vibrio harveyi]WCP81059.1 hypothetical protein PQE20_03305 [Vibrio harveyi]